MAASSSSSEFGIQDLMERLIRMGNSCFVTTPKKQVGIYLHWNGGRDSIESFCEYMRILDTANIVGDQGYALAQFSKVVGNYLGTDSIGLYPYDESCRDCDNGVYVLGKNWSIEERIYPSCYADGDEFKEQYEHTIDEMVRDIDNRQPEGLKLGRLWFDAKLVKATDIKVGDVVLTKGDSVGALNGRFVEEAEIVGICKDKNSEYYGLPYIGRYNVPGVITNEENGNNYLAKTKDDYLRVSRFAGDELYV